MIGDMGLTSIMTKNKKVSMTKKDVFNNVGRYVLGFIFIIIVVRFFYPERTRIREYREWLTMSHSVTKAYIYHVTNNTNTFYYIFTIDGVEYSGISRYSHLNPPYPREGDSIEVYYSETDPNVNLWSGEFPE